ncbi:MAG: methyltransferase domain-containing protein [Terriglobia bacterium]|jgi:SAM-dependent methyltransferase|nr:methyltransferase domain-containing protein [Terriglobia bacterium]
MEALKRAIPTRLRRWLSRKRFEFGRNMLWADRLTDFSSLRRTTPYRPNFGWNRGQCIDRYYIDKFFSAHTADIHGRALEIGDAEYTRKFGANHVTQIDVIDLDPNNTRATIHDDLCSAASIADNTYDCILCPQTLLVIYDFHAAIRTMHRILKPGGVLLATTPGIAQICPQPMIGGAGHDYWRFTDLSAQAVFGTVFGESNVQVQTFGNVLTAVALLHGLVSQEFTPAELDHHDPDYQVTIAIRAQKVMP